MDELGESLTRWTVRIALACYLARIFIDLREGRNTHSERTARWLWTTGLAFYLAHVAAAFHFAHHWSHADAYAHTAAQTKSIVGIHWGDGIYFNYAFTLLWLGDVALWWRNGSAHLRNSPGAYRTIQVVFAFMMFNATVVFGPPFWKWVALAVLLPLAYAWRNRATPK